MPADPPIGRKDPSLFEFVRLQQSFKPSEASRKVVKLASLVIGAKYSSVFLQFKRNVSFYVVRPNFRSKEVHHLARVDNKGSFDWFVRILKVTSEHGW